jgi:hypothetical protein
MSESGHSHLGLLTRLNKANETDSAGPGRGYRSNVGRSDQIALPFLPPSATKICLRRESPQNGSFRGIGRRLSVNSR